MSIKSSDAATIGSLIQLYVVPVGTWYVVSIRYSKQVSPIHNFEKMNDMIYFVLFSRERCETGVNKDIGPLLLIRCVPTSFENSPIGG